MYYVMVDYGCGEVECVGEYDSYTNAVKHSERLEDSWVCTDDDFDEEDDEPADIDSDFGYDPYMGECTYDC